MIYTAMRTHLFNVLGFHRPALIIQLLVQKYFAGDHSYPPAY